MSEPSPRAGLAAYAQAHRYAMEQAEPTHPQRVLRTVYRISGPLDSDRLEAAFHTVIGRHDALRMSFAYGDGGLRYRIADRVDWRLRREPQVPATRDGAVPDAILSELDAELLDRFDRSAAPLLTARIWRLAGEDWVLSLKVDHMVADVASVSVIADEVTRAYQGEPFAAPAPSFADWINAQARYLDGPDSAADRDYWTSTLASRPAGWDTLLPDFDMSESAENPPGEQGQTLPAETGKMMSDLLREYRLTPYMGYLTGLVACLVRRTGDPDVCVLGATANRARELAGLVGWCAHGLAYRVNASGAQTPADLARLVRAGCLRVMAHQRYPLLRWRLENQSAEQGRRLRRPYIFLHPVTEYFTSPTFAGMRTELVRGTGVEADPCLGFLVRRRPSGEIGLGLHYGGFGYDQEKAARLLTDFAGSLRYLVEHPDGKLAELPGWPD